MHEFAITYAALGLITAIAMKLHGELVPGWLPIVLTFALWPLMTVAIVGLHLFVWLLEIELEEIDDDTP